MRTFQVGKARPGLQAVLVAGGRGNCGQLWASGPCALVSWKVVQHSPFCELLVLVLMTLLTSGITSVLRLGLWGNPKFP